MFPQLTVIRIREIHIPLNPVESIEHFFPTNGQINDYHKGQVSPNDHNDVDQLPGEWSEILGAEDRRVGAVSIDCFF